MTHEVFEAVDALLACPTDLPSPAVRARLRQAAGLTQSDVAEVLGVHRIQVLRWEAGMAEPRRPNRLAYARLLRGLAAKYPDTCPAATDQAAAG